MNIHYEKDFLKAVLTPWTLERRFGMRTQRTLHGCSREEWIAGYKKGLNHSFTQGEKGRIEKYLKGLE